MFCVDAWVLGFSTAVADIEVAVGDTIKTIRCVVVAGILP